MAEGRFGIVVCDGSGRVTSATDGVAAFLGGRGAEAGASVADLFDISPDAASWVAAALGRANESAKAETTTIPSWPAGAVRLTTSRLAGGASPSVALLLESAKPVAPDVALPHEVARKTWHDIQNQLGGLKLYATFLKRKLGSADEQLRETADKIVQGVDAVSQSIANARRGEEGKENEKGQ